MISIDIKIEGKSIYLDQNTSVRMEMNNSFFDLEKIPGDIIYTFDVPAERNDIVFEHARYIYVNSNKVFEAEILIGGIPFSHGKLIIQKATAKKYSIGLTVNTIPQGFGDKKLKDNESCDYAILQGAQVADYIGAKTMVSYSFMPNSKVKFPAFRWENAYGELSDTPIFSAIQKSEAQWAWGIQYGNKSTDKRFHNVDYISNKWLYSFEYGEMYNPYTLKMGAASPDDSHYKNYYANSLNLSPCIQLAELVRKVIEEAGYVLIGDIVTDEKIANVFYYSLRNLDFINRGTVPPNYLGSYNHNIFKTVVTLKDHVPDMTNSELINTIFKLFGTTFYVDSQRKIIEIGLGLNIAKAKSIDLTAYRLTNETTIEGEIVEKQYIYQLGCFDETEILEADIVEGIFFYKANLPTASYTYMGKYGFVVSENAYYKCILDVADENASGSGGEDEAVETYSWQYYSGNVNKLRVGETGEEVVIKPNVVIPCITHIEDTITKYVMEDLPEIKDEGISAEYQTGTDTFRLILTYFYDHQSFDVKGYSSPDEHPFYISICSPINRFRQPATQSDYLDLNTEGDKSLGETFVAPYLEMLNNYEIVSEKFLLPLSKTLEVMNLLKPQEMPAENQTRWVLINNVKMLPIKIDFVFQKNKEMVSCEINFAKYIVNL